jgi:hypothetical protein
LIFVQLGRREYEVDGVAHDHVDSDDLVRIQRGL